MLGLTYSRVGKIFIYDSFLQRTAANGRYAAFGYRLIEEEE
jgi:hypothetical protein